MPRMMQSSSNREVRRHWVQCAAGLLTVGLCACSGIADEGKLPPDVQDPATLHTPSGAIARYRAALAELPGAFDAVMTASAILTDELAALGMPLGNFWQYTLEDSRQDLSGISDRQSNRLHTLRAQAREARGFLRAYAPDSSPALSGHLYAMEGYAEILLADLFCSGIPLSTVDFNGNYTLAAGSTTTEVYTHAVTLFDSALTLVSDSVRLQHLAAVGRGRALLALGHYAEAAAAVSAVPDDYQYQVSLGIVLSSQLTTEDSLRLWYFALEYTQYPATPSVADREGVNGLDYRSSGDPRTPVVALGQDPNGNTMYFPAKYPQSGTVTFTIADGVEARLIEAEAALQANADDGRWLGMLNHLRQTALLPDTVLPDLTDPGPDGAGSNAPRVDLLFRERAFWLYLTAHRQGDLRRLVRQYGRSPNAVYPTGFYQGGSGGYGTEIVVPVPESERTLNPKYTGCFHRNA